MDSTNHAHNRRVAFTDDLSAYHKRICHHLDRLRCNTLFRLFLRSVRRFFDTERICVGRFDHRRSEFFRLIDIGFCSIEQLHEIDVPSQIQFDDIKRVYLYGRMRPIVTNFKHLTDCILHQSIVRKVFIVSQRIQVALQHTQKRLQIKSSQCCNIILLNLLQLQLGQIGTDSGFPPVLRINLLQARFQPLAADLSRLVKIHIHCGDYFGIFHGLFSSPIFTRCQF